MRLEIYQHRVAGIGWYGFNLQFAAPENLSTGVDSLSKDFETIVYKQKQLGLNSVRLAFAFDDNNGIRVPVVNYTMQCTVPSVPDIAANLYPNTSVYTSINLASSATPHDGAPVVQNSICNHDMPNNYTYDRFIWTVNYYLDQVRLSAAWSVCYTKSMSVISHSYI